MGLIRPERKDLVKTVNSKHILWHDFSLYTQFPSVHLFRFVLQIYLKCGLTHAWLVESTASYRLSWTELQQTGHQQHSWPGQPWMWWEGRTEQQQQSEVQHPLCWGSLPPLHQTPPHPKSFLCSLLFNGSSVEQDTPRRSEVERDTGLAAWRLFCWCFFFLGPVLPVNQENCLV